MRADAFANPGRKRRIALQVSVILIALLGFAVFSQGNTTRFHMLPALQTEAASTGLILDVATDGQRILIAGEQGHILHSDDSGTSWTHAQVPVSLAITAVIFSGRDTAWAAAHDGVLLRSTDRGQSWQTNLTGIDVARMSADAAAAKVEQLQSEIEQADPDSIEDLEWALDDARFAFEDASEVIDDGVTMPLLDVWFEDDRNGYALGAYGILLRTTDGGSTWKLISDRLDNPDNYHLYGIARSVSGTLLVAGEAGTLLRSQNNGKTWDRLDSPYQGSFFGTVAAHDGGLLAFGLRGNVFRSIDEGDSWSVVDTGDQRTLMGGMTQADGSIVVVGSAGAVLVSYDHGASFDTIPTTGNRVYSSVAETIDDKLLLVGFGGVSILDGADDARVSGDSHE
jgi:photosystem II stability/assembly factor-like uncharacterized protein